jgi:hypothetical protein
MFTGPLLGNSPSGALPTIYTFNLDEPRTIAEPILRAAIEGNKLSSEKIGSMDIEIEFDRPFQEQTKYWTTRENLKHVTITPAIT